MTLPKPDEDEAFVKTMFEVMSHIDEARFEATCIDQVTGDTERAQGYTSPAGLVLQTESSRTVLIPPAIALEILDTVTAITLSTILRDFIEGDADDEERAHMAQALFDTVERMVQTRTHLELTFGSPLMVAVAYKKARDEHYANHVHEDEEED